MHYRTRMTAAAAIILTFGIASLEAGQHQGRYAGAWSPSDSQYPDPQPARARMILDDLDRHGRPVQHAPGGNWREASSAATGRSHRHSLPRHRYARVVEVEPIYAYADTTECPRKSDRSDSVAGTLVGGVIGGIAGNQLADRDNRVLLTLAGTAIGAVLGHQISARQQTTRHNPGRGDRHCGDRRGSPRDARPVAYGVTYEHRGRIHFTRTPDHPGDWIRLEKGLDSTHF